MAATLKWASARVGKDAVSRGDNVKRVQELLLAAGEKLPRFGADGAWGNEVEQALVAFRARHAMRASSHVEPNDPVLLLLAAKADILIQLPGMTGMAGVVELHRTLRHMNAKYNDGAQYGRGNRAIYGVAGNPQWAVQTFYDAAAKRTLIDRGPVQMDCTTYVNLMLSVYFYGNAHNNRYDASCKDFGWGSTRHLARDRYDIPLIRRPDPAGGPTPLNYFKDVEDIEALVRANPAALFVLEVGGTRWDKTLSKTVHGVVTHMALLHAGTVYECTTHQIGSACIDRPLREFMSNKKGIIYVFGPA